MKSFLWSVGGVLSIAAVGALVFYPLQWGGVEHDTAMAAAMFAQVVALVAILYFFYIREGHGL